MGLFGSLFSSKSSSSSSSSTEINDSRTAASDQAVVVREGSELTTIVNNEVVDPGLIKFAETATIESLGLGRAAVDSNERALSKALDFSRNTVDEGFDFGRNVLDSSYDLIDEHAKLVYDSLQTANNNVLDISEQAIGSVARSNEAEAQLALQNITRAAMILAAIFVLPQILKIRA